MVDFEADFSGAQLSAVVEGVVPGEAPVLTVEGSIGGEDGPVAARGVVGVAEVGRPAC